jgi:hypothetical protein
MAATTKGRRRLGAATLKEEDKEKEEAKAHAVEPTTVCICTLYNRLCAGRVNSYAFPVLSHLLPLAEV